MYSNAPIRLSTMRARVFDAPTISSLVSLRSLTLDGFKQILGVASRSQSSIRVLPNLEEIILHDIALGALRTLQFPGLRRVTVTDCTFLDSDLAHLLSGSSSITNIVLCNNINVTSSSEREAERMYRILLSQQKSLRGLTLQGTEEWNVFTKSNWSLFTSLTRIKVARLLQSRTDYDQPTFPKSLTHFTLRSMHQWSSRTIVARADVYIVESDTQSLLEKHTSDGWSLGSSFDLESNDYGPSMYVLAERKIWIGSVHSICKSTFTTLSGAIHSRLNTTGRLIMDLSVDSIKVSLDAYHCCARVRGLELDSNRMIVSW